MHEGPDGVVVANSHTGISILSALGKAGERACAWHVLKEQKRMRTASQTPAMPESCSHLCTLMHCQSFQAHTAHVADMHVKAQLTSRSAHAVKGSLCVKVDIQP